MNSRLRVLRTSTVLGLLALALAACSSAESTQVIGSTAAHGSLLIAAPPVLAEQPGTLAAQSALKGVLTTEATWASKTVVPAPASLHVEAQSAAAAVAQRLELIHTCDR